MAYNTEDILTSTKSYYNLPCAHRQWKHKGNCALVHGYGRSIHFVFAAKQLDDCGFVVDFGGLKWLNAWLEYMFDHTLLLRDDDPFLSDFLALQAKGACAVRTMPYGVGMEGTAQTVCEHVDIELRERTKGRCWIVSVEAAENEKNSAVYLNPNAGFKGWL